MKRTYLNPQQVAILLGISKQTLIRYEVKGVFPSAKRNAVNKWREYTEADVVKLKTILGRI